MAEQILQTIQDINVSDLKDVLGENVDSNDPLLSITQEEGIDEVHIASFHKVKCCYQVGFGQISIIYLYYHNSF